MKLTYYRKGEKAVFDWTGTSPQAPGPINLMLSEGMFKIDIGVYLIMVYDPDILFNQGYYDLIDVILPPKSLVQPEYPAPLSNRSHTLARKYDVISGALGQSTPELSTAASFGSSPHFLFSGTDGFGRFFHWSRSSTEACPGARSTTASTATPGGRSSRTSRASTWSRTIRCGSRSTTAPSIPAARAITAAATASRSGTGSSRRAWSRCTTTATARSPGGSGAESRAPSPARPWSAPTGAGNASRRRSTTSKSRPATCSSSSPRAAAAGAIRWSGPTTGWPPTCGAAW